MLEYQLSLFVFVFFSSRGRHTRCLSDWSSDVCSSDLVIEPARVDCDLVPAAQPVERVRAAAIGALPGPVAGLRRAFEARTERVPVAAVEAASPRRKGQRRSCEQRKCGLDPGTHHRSLYDVVISEARIGAAQRGVNAEFTRAR